MKELTITFKDKKYTTTDEKQIETYEKIVGQGDCGGIGCRRDHCPFFGSLCELYDYCLGTRLRPFKTRGITHSLETISEYPLNFMELEEDKTYLKEGREAKYQVVEGQLHFADDESHGVPVPKQNDRFKEYVPKMVSKTVERFVSDEELKAILERGFGESDVRKNKITVTYEVEK